MIVNIVKWRVGMVSVAILLTAMACTDHLAPPPIPTTTSVPILSPLIFFPQQETVEGERSVMEAELTGKLIVANDCLRVKATDSDTSYLLVWPPDFRPSTENAVIHVLNKDGQVVVSVGDEVYVSGGGVRSVEFLNEPLRQQLPPDCPGPYWIVGDEVRVTAVNPTSAPVVSVQTHASYIRLSREEMLKQADAIVVGQVTQVSATQFNQDSGEIWEATVGEAMPMALHYVEVQIAEVLAGGAGLEEKDAVTITVLGASPVESISNADHPLKSGDQVIIFLSATELAWRDGVRPVWCFIGAPAESALILQSDGLYHDGWRDESPLTLEDLEVQIAQQRLR